MKGGIYRYGEWPNGMYGWLDDASGEPVKDPDLCTVLTREALKDAHILAFSIASRACWEAEIAELEYIAKL